MTINYGGYGITKKQNQSDNDGALYIKFLCVSQNSQIYINCNVPSQNDFP